MVNFKEPFNEIKDELNKYEMCDVSALDINDIVDMMYQLHYDYTITCHDKNTKPSFKIDDLKLMIKMVELQITEEAVSENIEIILLTEILVTVEQCNIFLKATNPNNDSMYHQYMHKDTSIKPAACKKNVQKTIDNALKTLESYDTEHWQCLQRNGLKSRNSKKKHNVRPARKEAQITRALAILEKHNTLEYQCLQKHGLLDNGFEELADSSYSDNWGSDVKYIDNSYLLADITTYPSYSTSKEIINKYWKIFKDKLINAGVKPTDATLIYKYYR